jgi:probable phosphoglycerate mutase
MKEIFVFRHGETDWNRDGRMQGHIDIPLNETGRSQALTLQTFFAHKPIEVILCSDLGRAQETAKIARGTLDISIIIDSRQRETNLGEAEGLTREQVQTEFHPDVWQNWHSFPEQWDHRFPKGESKREHLNRVHGGLLDFLSKTPHTKIGVSSHGGSMRRLLHALRPDVSEPVVVGNCTLFKLDYSPARGLWVEDLNPLLHQNS